MNVLNISSHTRLVGNVDRHSSAGEFSLCEAGLPVGRYREIISSSEGLGWQTMAAALTLVKPFETILPNTPHIWIEYPFDSVDVELERNSTLFRGRIEAKKIVIHPANSSGSANTLTPVRCFHVFIKSAIIHKLHSLIFGKDIADLENILTVGQDDLVTEHLVLSARELLAERDSAFRSDYLAYAIASQIISSRTRTEEKMESRAPPSLSGRKMSMIHEFLENNLTNKFLFSDLAGHAGLSRTEFFVRFTHTTGNTPHRYLQKIRLEKAKSLLETTNFSLADIASVCGYTDQSHMNRCFKRYAGTTPGRFKRNNAS